MRVLGRFRLIAAVAAVALVGVGLGPLAGASAEAGGKKKNKGTIGYVVAGDRNDGGFYQGQVESVTETAKKFGYKTIIVDKVNPGAAQETFENLCRQQPDLIIGGGAELTDGFVPVAESPECEAIDFVLVAGFEPSEFFATVDANEDEAHTMGGVAASLLLDRTGGSVACVVGGPDLPFVRAMEANLQAGMALEDPNKEFLVTLTGDFEDAALATEALQALIDQGCELFYAYLGGALPAAWEFASAQDIPIISTSVNTCGVPPEVLPGGANIVASILYNPSLYLPRLIKDFSKGKFKEGRLIADYGVGDAKKLGIKDPNLGVGTLICDPSPEEQDRLDEVRAGIVSGDIEVIPESNF